VGGASYLYNIFTIISDDQKIVLGLENCISKISNFSFIFYISRII